MAYCVGNCLAWDSVSGNLTINEDPLGGLECLPGGQRIRIAGGTTGVAVAAKNNGLFMTTAGELATKVAPQIRNFGVGTGSSGATSGFTPGSAYNYAITGYVSCANPSAIYSMLLSVEYKWYIDFSIFPHTESNSELSFNGIVEYNGGIQSQNTNKVAVDKINSASGGRTNFTTQRTWGETVKTIVAPGTTASLRAYVQVVCAGYSPTIHGVTSQFHPTAIIGEFI